MTVEANVSRYALAHILIDAVNADAAILTWLRLTLVDVDWQRQTKLLIIVMDITNGIKLQILHWQT